MFETPDARMAYLARNGLYRLKVTHAESGNSSWEQGAIKEPQMATNCVVTVATSHGKSADGSRQSDFVAMTDFVLRTWQRLSCPCLLSGIALGPQVRGLGYVCFREAPATRHSLACPWAWLSGILARLYSRGNSER